MDQPPIGYAQTEWIKELFKATWVDWNLTFSSSRLQLSGRGMHYKTAKPKQPRARMMMITIAIDPNVRVGLGRYDEGERAE